MGEGSDEEGLNAELNTSDGSKGQQYRLIYNREDGCYTILNRQTGLVLVVQYGNKNSGANVWHHVSNQTDAQKWSIRALSGGGYSIISKLSGHALDLAWGKVAEHTNLQVFQQNQTAAQRFHLIPAAEKLDLADGIYTLHSKLDRNKLLDIQGGSFSDKTRVQLFEENHTPAQKFVINKMGSDHYRIMSYKTGKVVDAAGGKSNNGTNIWQFSANGSPAQGWKLRAGGDGSFYLSSLLNEEQVVDVKNGSWANGANIQLFQQNGTDAQRFFLQYERAIPVIEDGAYVIGISTDGGAEKVLDVSHGSRKMQAPIQLFTANGTGAQTFVFSLQPDGYYTIMNAKSKHMLDVRWGSRENGKRLWQFKNNGTLVY